MSNFNNKKYSDSIVLARVADGKSATSKLIETEYDEILKFDSENEPTFSPKILRIKVWDMVAHKYDTKFRWSLAYATDTEYANIYPAASEESPYEGAFTYYDASGKLCTKDEAYERVDMNVAALYANSEQVLKNKINEGYALLRLVIGPDNAPEGIKYLNITNGVSADMATLNIGAAAISAAVRDAKMIFNTDGLALTNGNFIIWQPKYTLASEVNEGNFNHNAYYYFDGYGYIRATSFQTGVTYYTRTEEAVLSTDKKGNLVITGVITATGGSFSGELKAATGSFSGKIDAEEGAIGGFYLDQNHIWSDGIELWNDKNGESFLGVTNAILSGELSVDSSIKFGSGGAWGLILYNPLNTPPKAHPSGTNIGRPVLETGQVTLTDIGYLQLGNIELYGGTGNTDGYIRMFNVDGSGQMQGGRWEIREDGTSNFSTIVADNAILKNTIMEQKTIQCVGSTMAFKDAWNIESSGSSFIPEGETTATKGYRIEGVVNLSEGDYILASSNAYRVEKVKVETLNPTYSEYQASQFNFDPNNSYIKQGSSYNKVVEFQTGQTHYRQTFKGGSFTFISLYGDKNGNELVFGTTVMRLGSAAVDYEYVETTDTEQQSWKRYFTKNGDQYTLHNGANFVRGETYYCRVIDSRSSDCIVSVSAERDQFSNEGVSTWASPQSLSFSSFSDGNVDSTDCVRTLSYTKHLILGKLSNSGLDALSGIDGYGLYADAVYLNGSLTTRAYEGNEYAGINTLSTVNFTKSKTGDTSPIVFWGGANGIGTDQICEAPFQVSQAGTVYAQNAVIENSTFVGGELRAATIYTAEIHGSTDTQAAGALSIYDADQGISFYKGTAEVFSIGTDGLKADSAYFISFDGKHKAEFFGSFKTSSDSDGTLLLKGPELTFYDNAKNLIGKLKGYNNDAGTEGISVLIGSEKVVSFEQDKAILQELACFKQNLRYGYTAEGNYIMELQKIGDIGYDLIII